MNFKLTQILKQTSILLIVIIATSCSSPTSVVDDLINNENVQTGTCESTYAGTWSLSAYSNYADATNCSGEKTQVDFQLPGSITYVLNSDCSYTKSDGNFCADATDSAYAGTCTGIWTSSNNSLNIVGYGGATNTAYTYSNNVLHRNHVSMTACSYVEYSLVGE